MKQRNRASRIVRRKSQTRTDENEKNRLSLKQSEQDERRVGNHRIRLSLKEHIIECHLEHVDHDSYKQVGE